MQERDRAVIPIENLSVSIYLNSNKIDEKSSGEDGDVIVQITSAGEYEVRGGDASMAFDVEGLEEPNENDTELDDIPPTNDTAPMDNSPPADSTPQTDEEPATEDNKGDTRDEEVPFDWIFLLIIVAILGALLIWRRKVSSD